MRKWQTTAFHIVGPQVGTGALVDCTVQPLNNGFHFSAFCENGKHVEEFTTPLFAVALAAVTKLLGRDIHQDEVRLVDLAQGAVIGALSSTEAHHG